MCEGNSVRVHLIKDQYDHSDQSLTARRRWPVMRRTTPVGRQGIFSIYTAFPLALAAVVAGDSLNYAVGYFFRGWITEKAEGSGRLNRIHSIFGQRYGLAVYVTRFAFTPLAIPVNLFSAGTGYPFYRFLVFDLFGELTWLVLYGSLGYVFASHWTLLGEVFNNVFGVFLGAAVAVIGL